MIDNQEDADSVEEGDGHKRSQEEQLGHTLPERLLGEATLFQEAWLNHVGLARFGRFVMTIFIAFIAATAFVQSKERESCEASKPYLIALLKQQRGVIDRQDKIIAKAEPGTVAYDNALDARGGAKALLDVLAPVEHLDCKDQYPIFPIVGI